MNPLPLYCIDTHVQYWQLVDRPRLSLPARNIFDDVRNGRAQFLLPHIVLAELFYLFQKQGRTVLFVPFIKRIRGMQAYRIEPASLEDIERLPAFPEIPEMHDRLIAIQANRFGATILTKDSTIQASQQVRCIW
jgi:PIN domain nuclease of toxin-antitoxin system